MAEKTVPHTEQSLTQVALNLGLHPDAAINQGPPEGKGKGVTIGRSRILLPPASVTRERVCCLLVLNLVSSTLSCIRQPRPRLLVWYKPETE
jgi:hypothetical protein